MKRRMTKLERQFKHILASSLTSGKSEKVAKRIASATVNRDRAKLAKSGEGPELVTEGGSRRQWYPGKGRERGMGITMLRIKPKGDPAFTQSLSAFAKMNSAFPDDVEAVIALAPGEMCQLGGGAWGAFSVTKFAPKSATKHTSHGRYAK